MCNLANEIAVKKITLTNGVQKTSQKASKKVIGSMPTIDLVLDFCISFFIFEILFCKKSSKLIL